MTLPRSKKDTLDNIVNDLQKITGVGAIVLGGSHCTGMAGEHSDLDLGIYYHEQTPLAIDSVKKVAGQYHIDGALTVTGFYEWGRWVNGGAWLNTKSGEVDFVYRNIEQVTATISKAQKGIWESDFEQQPPYGFSSVIYLAETFYCIPLYDPEGIIRELKEQVKDHPPELKRAIVQQALWSAQFTIWQAGKCAGKNDVYNTVGCFTRAVKSIVDALFALNETYPIGDKYALEMAAKWTVCPPMIKERIEEILCVQKNSLQNHLENLQLLFNEVVALSGEMYRPYFEL